LVSSNLTSSLLDAAICESRRLESFLGELNPLSNRLGGVESALYIKKIYKVITRIKVAYNRSVTVCKKAIIELQTISENYMFIMIKYPVHT
jgi:hypothetical protein